MKISAKQYATALYDAVKDKKTNELKSVIKDFIGIIAGNNDISKLDMITSEFEKVWNRERGIVEAEIVSARDLDKPVIKQLHNYIASLSQAKSVNMDNKIDKSLLGGVVVKYGDKILDGSMKTRLNDLKSRMAK